MTTPLTIVGIAGSLREGSYNKGLLRAALELLPENVILQIVEIENLPIFNQDLESPLPSSAAQFKAQVSAADAILIATPEYNYSVPGVLKNAIDWLSRPHGQNSLEDKPIAIMGASPGMTGTARAQYHLRQILVTLNGHALNKPEILVSAAQEKFDSVGKLTDEKTRAKIRELLEALVEWTKRLKQK